MIYRMKEDDIAEVVRLHEEALKGDLFVLMGSDFLCSFYEQVVNSPYAVGFIYEINGQMAGFASGIINGKIFYRRLIARIFLKICAMVIFSVLRHPLLMSRYLIDLLRNFLYSPLKLPAASVSSIVVVNNLQGRGIGTELLEALLEHMANNDTQKCWTMTGIDNVAAVRLYKKMGFAILTQVHFGLNKRNFYIADIDAIVRRNPRLYKIYPVSSRRILLAKFVDSLSSHLPSPIESYFLEKLHLLRYLFIKRPSLERMKFNFHIQDKPCKRNTTNLVVLSFDLDRAQCWDNLEYVVNQLRQRKFKAAFNLLTDGDYKIEWNKIIELKQEGFEFGLHGRRHDVAFGYRKKTHIQDELTNALSRFPFKVSGFRSPALSISKTLLEQLEAMGFRYDSSVMVEESRDAYRPFRFNGGGLWEFPIILSDTRLFLDWRFSQDKALEFVKGFIENLSYSDNILVLNFHPCYTKRYSNFYTSLYDILGEAKDIEIVTMEEAVKFLEENEGEKKHV